MILDKDPGSNSVFLGRVQLQMFQQSIKLHAKIVSFLRLGVGKSPRNDNIRVARRGGPFRPDTITRYAFTSSLRIWHSFEVISSTLRPIRIIVLPLFKCLTHSESKYYANSAHRYR